MDKNKSLVRTASSISSRKYWRLPLLGVAIAALAMGGLGLSQQGASQDADSDVTEQRVLPVSTQILTLSNSYPVQRTYSGQIQARRVSDIGFELTGTLIDFPLKEGDRIQQGATLARLDTRSLSAQKKQLMAQRIQAVAQLSELETGPRQEEIDAAKATVQDLGQQVALADRLSQRRKSLFEQGAVSKESYEERFFNAQSLRKRQEQAQKRLEELQAGTRVERVASQDAQLLEIDARLEALEIQRSKTSLKAPFSGLVAQKLVSEGVVLNAGQPIVRLVESGAMEAHIGVPQAIADQMKLGQTLPIKVGNKRYRGTIAAFFPEIDPTSRTVTVMLEFSPQSTLTIGQTTQLIWEKTETQSGFWLPTTAVIAGEQGLWSTYVLKPIKPQSQVSEGVFSAVRRDVEVIHSEGNRVYVRGMLSPGEEVINQGTHRLASGQRVKVERRGIN